MSQYRFELFHFSTEELDFLFLPPRKYHRRKIRQRISKLRVFESGDERPDTNLLPKNRIFLMSLTSQMAYKHQYSVHYDSGNTLVWPNQRGVRVIVDSHFLSLQPSINPQEPKCEPFQQKKYR